MNDFKHGASKLRKAPAEYKAILRSIRKLGCSWTEDIKEIRNILVEINFFILEIHKGEGCLTVEDYEWIVTDERSKWAINSVDNRTSWNLSRALEIGILLMRVNL